MRGLSGRAIGTAIVGVLVAVSGAARDMGAARSVGGAEIVKPAAEATSTQRSAAATFTVDSTADAHDADTTDGVCAARGGACTLRAAVEQANALGGTQTISIPGGIYTLTEGSLRVDSYGCDITLSGAGILSTAIDGDNSTRILYVATIGSSVTVENLYVEDGSIGGDGGCFLNYGTLQLHGVYVTGCKSAYDGGAIYNTSSGVLEVWSSTFNGNSANTTLSGGNGGALYNEGHAQLANVTLYSNMAQDGGGVFEAGMWSLKLTECWFRENYAVLGGAIYVMPNAGATVNRCTFSNNSANSGGAIFSHGPLDFTNATFSGNSASGAGGCFTLDGGSMLLRNVTITGSIDDGSGGALYLMGPTFTSIANTLIANNGTNNCNTPFGSAGHNLEDHDTCGFATVGDLVNVTPLLGALADNQGLEKTVALLPGSPGIDCGDDSLAPTSDQRGVSRPQDGDGSFGATSDIGAYEYVDLIFVDTFEEGGAFKWSSTVQ